MKKRKIIGLTGQSGAGKSTVAKYFEDNGIKVINADTLVHKLYQSNSPCVRAVCAIFGDDLLKSDNSLDRKLLAQRAFLTKQNTDLLSSIVHPFVMSEFLAELKKIDADFVIYDAPQLFESNSDAICDCIISVIADKDIRLQRICKRDNITEEYALMRINAQLDEEFFINNSDYVIENNSTEEILIHQLQKILTESGVK